MTEYIKYVVILIQFLCIHFSLMEIKLELRNIRFQLNRIQAERKENG